MVSLFVLAFLLGIGFVIWLSVGSPQGGLQSDKLTAQTQEPTRTPKPTRTPRPTRTPKPTKTPRPSPAPSSAPASLKVGIVAGHWQNDAGATCPDGTKEVDINLDVAGQVVEALQKQGYQAEILPEFSEELKGYKADAFVSIHTDSCEVQGLSGFKVARVASSAIPQEEDRLVSCLSQEYGLATGLSFNKDTITYDMTDYHAFWEIDPSTPGAIIELGFMYGDWALLTQHSDRAADGVARGIECFLRGP